MFGFSARSSAQQNHVRAYRAANEQKILREFAELLSAPNVATDRENIAKNAALIIEMMKQRGIEGRLLETSNGDGPPAVFGELKTPGATRTLVFYAHYDGQPTDPSKWTGNQPWQPVLRTASIEAGGKIVPFAASEKDRGSDPRIYARSASDDKAPVVALLSAIDALRASGAPLTTNVKFFFEGEEEAGSRHLEDIVRRHAGLLGADAWIICDGPVHQNGQKLVFFGARGIVTAQITVYGPNRDLHSGHYGNWAPNPAMMLSKLLASMKDDQGKVLIEGFYEDVIPLGDAEKQALAEAPPYDQELMRQLGFAQPETPGKSLGEVYALPSLNIDGINSSYVGEKSRTIIPSIATAAIDMRLAKGNDYRRQIERLKAHIRKQGYFVTDGEPSETARRTYPRIASVISNDGYNASRTPMDLPISRAVVRAVQSATQRPVVRQPTVGGSVPLYIFSEILNAPLIGVPLANYDNNQHSENENIRLQNLWDGIEIFAAILTMRE